MLFYFLQLVTNFQNLNYVPLLIKLSNKISSSDVENFQDVLMIIPYSWKQVYLRLLIPLTNLHVKAVVFSLKNANLRKTYTPPSPPPF